MLAQDLGRLLVFVLGRKGRQRLGVGRRQIFLEERLLSGRVLGVGPLRA